MKKETKVIIKRKILSLIFVIISGLLIFYIYKYGVDGNILKSNDLEKKFICFASLVLLNFIIPFFITNFFSFFKPLKDGENGIIQQFLIFIPWGFVIFVIFMIIMIFLISAVEDNPANALLSLANIGGVGWFSLCILAGLSLGLEFEFD